jgi:hypothetical protein
MMTSPVAFVVNEAPGTVLSSALKNVQGVGAAWMLSSVLFTTYSTTKYLKYSTPSHVERSNKSPLSRVTLLTLARFSGSLILGLVAYPNLHIVDRIKETLELLPQFALPAVFLFTANYSNAISLDRIGISLTYTSKCAIPLITLILTLVLDGVDALPSVPVLLTLVPIALGIATASWNHPRFEILGFIAAFVSCTAQSALNVTSKHVMKRLGVGGPVAQRSMVAVGLAITSVFSLFQLASSSKESKLSDDNHPPAWLALMAVTAYHVEYVLSFIFVNLVAPITYSACDAVRRLGIIISGHCMFGGPAFTVLNILGIGMALGGALAFSILNN